jgi:TolB-like protein
VTPVEKSIAVLPFTNMSDDASNEFFADGISEEILNALAKVKELKVAGRTSAFAFKGRNEDLREIGEALGVNHILEGSVRKAGNTVRVTAQLIQVSDGFHLWSETFDRELTDIFAIQDEIANAILAAMKAELLEGQSIASTQVDPVVYEKYLLGKHRSHSRTNRDLTMAADMFKEATEMDPGFAPAWAQRGITTLLLSETAYGDIPFEDSQRTARRFLDNALEIDPDSAEALAGMGLFHQRAPGGRKTIETSIPLLERSLEINPANIDASNWLQLALIQTGNELESIRILEDMVDRDPLYGPAVTNLLWGYGRLGRLESNRQLVERIKPHVTDEAILADIESVLLIMEGRFGEAYPKTRLAYDAESGGQQSSVWMEWSMSELELDEELLERKSGNVFSLLPSLVRLGRNEEGFQVARDESNRFGDPSAMINFYHFSRQSKALVDYVNERWPDLTDLEAELVEFNGFGHTGMIFLAHAYRQTGDGAKYDQALEFAKAWQDREIAQRFDSLFFHFGASSYWAVAGDLEKSLSALEKSVENGLMLSLGSVRLRPEFDELRDNEKFIALTLEAHEQFNTQRVHAGLEPIDPGRGP